MSTTTETETKSSSASNGSTYTAPEFTILTRVASIPMIYSSLVTINDTLSNNTYTRSSYSTAKGLSTTAIRYTEPIQVRLAPLIERADGIANKAVDVVESRYPYPFKAQPEEVATYVHERRESASAYVRERRESAVNVANKTIDDNFKNPAINVAQGIDQRFSPIVDYFEVAVTRFNNDEASSSKPSDTKYQYQRAIALSRSLKEHIYTYSGIQIKQLQSQSVILQRATETAQKITVLGASSIADAQSRVHALSDNMLHELQYLQASAASIQASIASSPAHIRESLSGLSSAYPELTATIQQLSAVLSRSDLSLQERAKLATKEVSERVGPMLDRVRESVAPVLERVGEIVGAAKTNAGPETLEGNGNGNGKTHANGNGKSNGDANVNGNGKDHPSSSSTSAATSDTEF